MWRSKHDSNYSSLSYCGDGIDYDDKMAAQEIAWDLQRLLQQQAILLLQYGRWCWHRRQVT